MSVHGSGKTHRKTLTKVCPRGTHCPYFVALRRRGAYQTALARLNKKNAKHQERLMMARFVKQVAEEAAASEAIDKSDVWDNLLGPGGNGEAGKWENSYLKEDIDRMVGEIDKAQKAVDRTSKRLVSYISSMKFQKHLVRYHRDVQMDSHEAMKVYGVYLSSNGSAVTPKYREIDHFLAVLTENLALSDEGTKFLEEIFNEKKLKKQPAFDEFWGYFGKATSFSESMGKFLYNTAPVLTDKMTAVINRRAAKSISQVLDHDEVKPYLEFLNKKLKVNLRPWLKKRATEMGSRAKLAIRDVDGRRDFKKAVARWNDLPEGELSQDMKKLEGAWFGLTLGIVSFAAATVKIGQDFKNAKIKDWVGTLGEFFSLTKTLSETFETKFKVQAGILKAADAGDEAVGRVIMRASQARGLAIGLGVAVHVCNVVLGIISIVDGLESRDWDKVALATASFAVAYVGFFAALANAALVSGVCTVIGIAIVILTALILDPPIIDYLEDTYWGEDQVYSISKTIDKYYTALFTLEIEFKKNERDSGYSFIQITSNALSDNTPVLVTVKRQHDGKSLGKKAVYPGWRSVRGKGRVLKGTWWGTNRPDRDKLIQVFRAWEIWPAIKRDGKTTYKITAGLDPDHDGVYELKDSMSDIKFAPPSPPKLIKALIGNLSYLNRFGSHVYHRGRIADGLYFEYPASGKIILNVHTRYGSGCRVVVKAEEYNWFFSNEDISKVGKRITLKPENKWHLSDDKAYDEVYIEETRVGVPIKKPSRDDEYTLLLTWYLKDPKGETVDKHSTKITVYRE